MSLFGKPGSAHKKNSAYGLSLPPSLFFLGSFFLSSMALVKKYEEHYKINNGGTKR